MGLCLSKKVRNVQIKKTIENRPCDDSIRTQIFIKKAITAPKLKIESSELMKRRKTQIIRSKSSFIYDEKNSFTNASYLTLTGNC